MLAAPYNLPGLIDKRADVGTLCTACSPTVPALGSGSGGVLVLCPALGVQHIRHHPVPGRGMLPAGYRAIDHYDRFRLLSPKLVKTCATTYRSMIEVAFSNPTDARMSSSPA
jgi:hypothetical protein